MRLIYIIGTLFCLLFGVETGISGIISGTVTQENNRQPLKDAVVRIARHDKYWCVSDTGGKYSIPNIPVGEYIVLCQMIGFHDAAQKVTVSSADDTIALHFVMAIEYIKFPEIVVTPGRYEVMTQQPHTLQSMRREDIKSIPQLGEDFYRSLIRFPGITADDYSARFNIRGGANDEVLAMLDGLELYDPFHLKDYGGALSILDMEAVGEVDLMTGGFPVEYGDRLSGVLDMKSFKPSPGENRTMFGISFTNARFLTEGAFGKGKGNWLVSLRRGYLDIILNLLDEDSNSIIRYYDAFAKINYTINKNHSFLIDVLYATDYTKFMEDYVPKDMAESGYDNSYLWGTWNYTPSNRIFAKTIGSLGRISQEREGTRHFSLSVSATPRIEDYVNDDRKFIFAGFKQDWAVKVTQNNFLRAGIDAKSEWAEYDYFLSQGTWKYSNNKIVTHHDTSEVELEPAGYEAAGYVSNQWHIAGPLTIDAGIRFDKYGYLHANRWSPRGSASLALTEKTILRFALGNYYQSPLISGIPLQEPFWNNPRYGTFDPPSRATQYVAGIEQLLPGQLELRVEGYYKDLRDPWPRFESLDMDLELFQETVDDRIVFFPTKGASKGIEFFIKRPFFGKWGFWFNYIWSRVTDRIYGLDIPRIYDQRHQLSCDVNFRPNDKWNIHCSWQFHTGRPQTPVTYKLDFSSFTSGQVIKDYGNIYSIRLPSYSRIDVKAIRKWKFTRYSLVAFLEIINLFGYDNVRRWQYRYRRFSTTQIETYKVANKWLPFLPSIGVAVEL